MVRFNSKIKDTKYFYDAVLIVTFFFLTGFIVVPIFFIADGAFCNIRDNTDETTMPFELFNVIYAILLLVGSLIGIGIGEFVFNRIAALYITVAINGIVAALIWVATISIPKISEICFLCFGISAGMIGPILVSFISDQYGASVQIVGDTFIYSICCCHLFASLYILYALKLMQSSLFLIVSVICLGFAFVTLIIINLSLKKYFIIKKKTSGLSVKPTKQDLIQLFILLVPATALMVIINNLEHNVNNWVHENFTYNRSFDPSIWYQQGYAAVFLIPVFLVYGIKLCPKFSLLLGCFSILLAAFLWPYTERSCILDPDAISAGPKAMSVNLFNQRGCENNLNDNGQNYRATEYANKIINLSIPEYEFVNIALDNISQPCLYQLVKHDLRRYDQNNIYKNYMLKRKSSTGGYPVFIDSHFTIHKRHVSRFPTVMIIADSKWNCTVRLTHLDTNSTIELPSNTSFHVIQLIPGKWSELFQYVSDGQTYSHTNVFEYKPGGFYYQQLVVKKVYNNSQIMVYVKNPVAVMSPYTCDINPPILNIMCWFIIFGRLIIAISVLKMAIQNLDIELKYVAVIGCFISFYLAYIISIILNSLFDTNDYNITMPMLLIILPMNVCSLVLVSKDVLEHPREKTQPRQVEQVKATPSTVNEPTTSTSASTSKPQVDTSRKSMANVERGAGPSYNVSQTKRRKRK